MALLKEHFLFGVRVGGLLHLGLFLIAAYFGLFSGLKWIVLSFFGGFVAVVVGSILPDMDAPRSPIHDTMLVSFGSIVTIFVEKLSVTYLPLLLVPLFSVWLDRNHLPSHRGFIHSIEAGILFGFLLFVGLYVFVTTNILFCLWCGGFLSLGDGMHLLKDNQLR